MKSSRQIHQTEWVDPVKSKMYEALKDCITSIRSAIESGAENLEGAMATAEEALKFADESARK